MNNREKAKAVQKKFNQRLGIYYGVMAAGVIVAAIGLMTQINVLTLLGVVAFFAGLVILSWVSRSNNTSDLELIRFSLLP